MKPYEKAVYHLVQSARVGFFLGNRLLSNRFSGPVISLKDSGGPIPKLSDLLKDMRRMMACDLAHVDEGLYPMPLNGVAGSLKSLRSMADYFADLPAIHRRRREESHQEIFEEEGWAEQFPRYYLQNFHFQSDGWLSEASAKRYDYQVEVVFLGVADMMRRQLLAHIIRWMRDQGEAASFADLACGTGRFLSQLRAAVPHAELTGVDLSPYYIDRAKQRFPGDQNIALMEGAMEDLPLEDASLDGLSSIFVFHELPPKIRSLAVNEMARVLKPGGRFFHMDTIQKGDHLPYDALLDLFPDAFHEPYYKSYVECDLNALCASAGLVPVHHERAFFSKVSIFEKPTV